MYCDFDFPSFFTQSKPKARKEHKCSECGRTIFSGEEYLKTFGVWGDIPHTYKRCQECSNLSDFYLKELEGCEIYGLLHDYVFMAIEECEDCLKVRKAHRLYLLTTKRWRKKNV